MGADNFSAMTTTNLFTFEPHFSPNKKRNVDNPRRVVCIPGLNEGAVEGCVGRGPAPAGLCG
jgi:hypothetical protein